MLGPEANRNHEIPLEEWLKDAMGSRYIYDAESVEQRSSPENLTQTWNLTVDRLPVQTASLRSHVAEFTWL